MDRLSSVETFSTPTMTYLVSFSRVMEFNKSWTIGLTLAIVISIFMVLAFFFNARPDPTEPPYIPQTIPVVGHLIEVMRKGTNYYDRVRYSLFEKHFYVSNSHSHLALAVQSTLFLRIAWACPAGGCILSTRPT